MVFLEVVAEEAQLKSALALERTMASPSIATESAQEGDNMLLEIGGFDSAFRIGTGNEAWFGCLKG